MVEKPRRYCENIRYLFPIHVEVAAKAYAVPVNVISPYYVPRVAVTDQCTDVVSCAASVIKEAAFLCQYFLVMRMFPYIRVAYAHEGAGITDSSGVFLSQFIEISCRVGRAHV